MRQYLSNDDIDKLHELICCGLINEGLYQAGDGDGWEFAHKVCKEFRKYRYEHISRGIVNRNVYRAAGKPLSE